MMILNESIAFSCGTLQKDESQLVNHKYYFINGWIRDSAYLKKIIKNEIVSSTFQGRRQVQMAKLPNKI